MSQKADILYYIMAEEKPVKGKKVKEHGFNVAAKPLYARKDEELVRACLKEDKHAFEEIIVKYTPKFYVTVKGYVDTEQEAEDIIQETFMRGFQRLKECKEPARVGAWLYGIMKNLVYDWFKAKNKERILIKDLALEIPREQNDEKSKMLEKALLSLTEESRQIVILKHRNGLTCEQIAKKLGKETNTVAKALSRAYARLANELKVEIL